MQSRFFVLAVAALAALIWASEWLAGDAGVAAVPQAVLADPAPGAAAPVVPRVEAPPARSDPGEATKIASSAELARKFNSATSLRAFVYDALKRPEQGGYQYAFAALGMCRYDGATVRLAESASAQQKAAHEALARRCDMSAQDREAARMQIVADRGGSFERDPYLSLAFDRISALDDTQKRRVTAAILETEDPLAIQYLKAEVTYLQDGRTLRGVYFAGRHYPAGDGAGMFDHALELAVCSLGLDCGPGSLPLLMMCVHKGWCAPTMREAIRDGLGPEQALLFNQIEVLAAKLVYEIGRKNTAAFVAG